MAPPPEMDQIYNAYCVKKSVALVSLSRKAMWPKSGNCL